MIIPLKEIAEKTGCLFKGAIEIGAHLCEGQSEYLNHGYEHILFIEANPYLCQVGRTRLSSNSKLLEAVLLDTTGQDVDFRLFYSEDKTNMGCSSIFNRSQQFAKMYPMIKDEGTLKLKTTTLDDLLKKSKIDASLYNSLFIDVQGAELKVLKGALETLKHIDFIVCEYATKVLYEGGVLFPELVNWLADVGFHLIIKRDVQDSRFPMGAGWGDSVFLRRQ